MRRTAILSVISLLTLITTSAFGVVTITLPDTLAYPNDTLSVPIKVSDLTGLEVYSYQFKFNFDSTIAKVIGVDSAKTLTEQWGATWINSKKPGEIVLGNYGAVPLKNSGVLIYIRFKMIGKIGDSTQLTLQNFEFNAGIPSAKLTNGSVKIIHLPLAITFKANVSALIKITIDGIEKSLPFDTTWAYGTTHSIGTGSPQHKTADIRFVFNSWSDGGSMVHSVTPQSNTNFTLNMNEEYLLTINSKYGTVTGAGWYVSGKTVTVTVDSLAQQTDSTRYIFKKWNGTGNSSYTGVQRTVSVVMNDPVIETAEWNLQYHLKIDSRYGTPIGAGWHNQNDRVVIGIDSLVLPVSGTRYIFDSWIGKGSTSYSGTKRVVEVTMSGSVIEQATWRTEHYLTVKSSPDGIASFKRSGWYAKHQTVVTDTAEQSLNLAENFYSLLYWRVDGKTVIGNPKTIVMDTAHVAEAHYQIDSVLAVITTNIDPWAAVTIDGMKYPSPYSKFWALKSQHLIGIDSIQMALNQKTRYWFRSWSDHGAQHHAVKADSVLHIAALLEMQHYLHVDTHPPGLVKFAETGWYGHEATVRISSAPAQVILGQETLNFKGWILDNIPAGERLTEVIMDKPHTAIGLYKDLFFIKGQITDRKGNHIPNARVILSGASQDTVTISDSNEYAFNLLATANYQVTPHLDGFQFDPANRSYIPLSNSLSNQNFVAVDTVKPTISLIYPNGGEQLKGASTDTIVWQAEDNLGIDSIAIELVIEHGKMVQSITKLSPMDKQQYSWKIPDVTSSQCQIRIKAIDFDGNPAIDVSDALFSITSATSVDNELTEKLPTTFEVQQNYPNPFNSATIIRFQLPEVSSVTIKIFNMMGQEIVTLADQQFKPGYHQVNWGGKDQVGKLVSSGIYFYRLEASSQIIIRKLLYVQ